VAQLATAYWSAGCMIEGEESELTWTHRVPFLRSKGEPIVLPPSPEPRPSKLKKICCPYCYASRYIALDDCRDFNKKFPPPQNTTNGPPISSTMPIPRSDRMDESSEDGWRFTGYDRPRSTRGRITEGTGGEGGRIPPSGGNVARGGDHGDSDPSSDSDNSDCPPFDLRKILGSRKDHRDWDEPRKGNYHKWLRQLLKLRKRQRNSKGSAHLLKKPERLGVDPFDGDPKDTQRFIQDIEIKLSYFREFLVDDMDKISFVIPLLRTGAKEWYHSINIYINEDAAIHDKRLFDQNNVLRTWESFRKGLVCSFG